MLAKNHINSALAVEKEQKLMPPLGSSTVNTLLNNQN